MAERFIPEHRRTQFKAKNTFKPDELRRRREEQQVEIRKAKREENLAKRRGISGRDGTQMSAPGASLGASIDSDDEGGTIESQVRNSRSFMLPLSRRLLLAESLSYVKKLSMPPWHGLPSAVSTHSLFYSRRVTITPQTCVPGT